MSDSLYHLLFAHPGMVAELLRAFVDEPWVADLDMAAMERVNVTFTADTGDRREGDMIWRIPLKAGGDAYLLLMLEFQSTPERWMALRALVYAGLLWQDIVREKRLMPDGRLPPVFPVVIYNGIRRWTMPEDLGALIALPADSPLWRWQPSMRYYLLDEGRLGETARANRDNLAALLFRLETIDDQQQFGELAREIMDWFRGHESLRALMAVFLRMLHRAASVVGAMPMSEAETEDMLQMRTMVETRMAEIFEREKRDSREEGRQEGRQGEAATMLMRQLEHRFGPLSDAVQQRIAAADVPTLEDWILRVLDANSVDYVLGDDAE